MKINENQVETKAFAGKSGDGSPLVYLVTKGGLHAIFKKNKTGTIESIAAAPHRGIAQWMAEEKDKDIKWDKGFLSKSDEDFTADQTEMFDHLRNVFFSPERVQKSAKTDIYMVYDTNATTIQLIKKEDLVTELKSKEISDYCLVRNFALTEPVYLAKDHPEFANVKD